MAETLSWGGRVRATVRAAPLLLSITVSAFVVLLFASIGCFLAGAAGPGDVVVGACGASAAALGVVLVSDIKHSAVAMEQFANAVRSARVNLSGGRWTAGRYRLLGGAYVVIGSVFAVLGWSGVINWRR